MFVEEIGEFALIKRIATLLGPPSKKVVVGIGDDAAVIAAPRNGLILTTDSLIEGIHFNLQFISPYQLGYKALAVNLSDVAAMAGIPTYALVSLGLPPRTKVEWVEDFYKGMKELAEEFGVQIIGGDISKSPTHLISLTLLGEVELQKVKKRALAQVGDLLLVTGKLGASAAGLELFLHPRLDFDSAETEKLKQAHLKPRPRINEARLAAEKGCHALEDISDGLAGEIHHICEQSGTGALLREDKIPLAPGVSEVAKALGKEPLEFALSGGEDYELVFTAPPDKIEGMIEAIHNRTGTLVTVIGEIKSSQEGIFLLSSGKRKELSSIGYEHFKNEGSSKKDF